MYNVFHNYMFRPILDVVVKYIVRIVQKIVLCFD